MLEASLIPSQSLSLLGSLVWLFLTKQYLPISGHLSTNILREVGLYLRISPLLAFPFNSGQDIYVVSQTGWKTARKVQNSLIWPPFGCCLVEDCRLFYIDARLKMPHMLKLDTFEVEKLAKFKSAKTSPLATCASGRIWVFDKNRSESTDITAISWTAIAALGTEHVFTLITSCNGHIFLYIHAYSPSSYAIAVYNIENRHYRVLPLLKSILNPRWLLAVEGELVLFGHKAVWDSSYTERISVKTTGVESVGVRRGNLLDVLGKKGWRVKGEWGSDYYYPVRWEGQVFVLGMVGYKEMKLAILKEDLRSINIITVN